MPKMKSEAARLRQLTAWYRDPELGKPFFEWAARQARTVQETTIDDLMKDVGLSRSAAIFAAKTIAKEGFASFITGRHRKKSRIRWNFAPSSLGLAAMGRREALEQIAGGEIGWRSAPGDESELEKRLGRAVVATLRSFPKQDLDRLLAMI